MIGETPANSLSYDALEAAKRGDPAACRSLVGRYQRRVFAQLRGMLAPVGHGALVEDLAQETFLRAFRALPRFVGDERKIAAWLVTIAARVALNELRRRRRRVEVLDTVTETVATGRGDPMTTVVGQGIGQALSELPDAFRAAFLLRELHGLEYAEIARALEIDLGTVKSRLARARKRLREALGKEVSL